MNKITQNQIIDYQYISDWRKYTNLYYNKQQNSVQVIYFQFDYENSVMDSDELMHGQYEIFGDSSGYKWKQIYFLPLFNGTPIQNIEYQKEQSGLTKEYRTEFLISSAYNINPSENDFIYIIDPLKETKTNNNDHNKLLFKVVSKTQQDFSNVDNLIKIEQKQYNYTMDSILPQISDKKVFVPYYNKIFDYNDGKFIIKSMEKLNMVYSDSKYFDFFTSWYVHKY